MIDDIEPEDICAAQVTADASRDLSGATLDRLAANIARAQYHRHRAAHQLQSFSDVERDLVKKLADADRNLANCRDQLNRHISRYVETYVE